MDTIGTDDRHTIDTPEKLAALYKEPAPAVIAKVTDFITPPGRAFIAASPFLVMATANADGIDCSPKGDAPGFVEVADDRTLLIPDRPGNNRIDGMKNLLQNPKIGIIFMAPGSDVTYRVNGTARISVDPALLERCAANGKLPRAVTVVTVEEAFSHCPKAFVRARLWAGAGQGHPADAPTHGDFAAWRDGGDRDYAEKYNADYAERMKGQLY
jgi:hypothetical protein